MIVMIVMMKNVMKTQWEEHCEIICMISQYDCLINKSFKLIYNLCLIILLSKLLIMSFTTFHIIYKDSAEVYWLQMRSPELCDYIS